MNIAIDGRSITWAKGSGIGTYTSNIINEFHKIDTVDKYLLLCCDNDISLLSDKRFKYVMTSKKHTTFFDNIYIPNYLKKSNIDLYHIPQNGIGLNDNIECLKVVTIHDLIPYVMPETVGVGYLKNFLKFMPEIIEKSDAIITVSEYSKRDILKFFPSCNKEKIFVTPLAANSKYKVLNKEKCKKEVQKRYGFNSDYLLYIGGFSSRKNVKIIIDSLKDCRTSLNKEVKLLIAGAMRDDGLNIKEYCKNINMDNYVIFTDYIDDDFLPILYNGCSLFIYPSLYEGFGLPPLEAISCGTPVITSNTTSIPEVVKDSAILINPLSKNDLSHSITNIINNKDLQNQLISKGLIRSHDFSWRNTAINTLNIYKKVYEYTI